MDLKKQKITSSVSTHLVVFLTSLSNLKEKCMAAFRQTCSQLHYTDPSKQKNHGCKCWQCSTIHRWLLLHHTHAVCSCKRTYNACHHNNFEFKFHLITVGLLKHCGISNVRKDQEISIISTKIFISHNSGILCFVRSYQTSAVSGSKHVDKSRVRQ